MPLDNNDPGEILDPAHGDNPETVVAGKPTGQQPSADAWEATDDGNQVKHGDKTYIRAEALQAERAENAKLRQALNGIEPLMPEIEEYIEHKKQARQAAVDRTSRGSEIDADLTPEDLEGFAIVRGYYTQDNKPDTKRAQAELNIMGRVADRRAERLIGPDRATNQRERAHNNTARAMSRKFVDGEPIADPKYLQAAFEALPEEYRADPTIADITTVIAAGLEYLDQRKEGRVRRGGGRREPNYTEGGGRGRVDSGGDSFDALDRAAAKARGKTVEEWGKLSKQVTGGGLSSGTILDEV